MTSFGRKWGLLLLLFLVALVPRLPGLGRFLTTDESYFITAAGTDVLRQLLDGNLRGTYWHFYPGVTLTWLESLGIVGRYLTGGGSQSFSDFLSSDLLSLLVAVRLPFALLSAAGVAAIYLLAKRLLPGPLAWFGALLLALDPFFLAHSRVAHGDAPVSVFMAVSALALFVVVSTPSQPPPARGRESVLPSSRGEVPASQPALKNPFLWLSAVAGGLAALTKAPGQFMAVFVIGLCAFYAVLDWRAARSDASRNLQMEKKGVAPRPAALYWLMVILAWGVISLATFIILWPSMWVDPVGTLWQMLDETFFKVEAGHLVFFMGQATLDPGFWFYPVVVAFRLTPVTLAGVLLSLLLFAPPLRRRTGLFPADGRPSALFLLWLFVVSLWLFGSLSPKKQDRYLLPLFPFLDLLAAVGWVGVISLAVAAFLPKKENEIKGGQLPSHPIHWQLLLPSLVLVALQAIPVFTYYPYYLAYFNPLLGGPARAVEVTLIGWGEGMEQVAGYLNAKPNAESLYVAAVPSQTLLPYFAGTGENFYTNDVAFRADYVVLYINQWQRLAPSPEIVRYFQAQPPEKVIEIAGLPYAEIYASTPRILPDIPPDATPLNIGLGNKIRLAGYFIGPESLSLTLFWHALAPLAENYTVSVRGYAADGRLLAQQDQWPVDGLLPTSQWRQGDYVADTHLLTFAPADTPLLARYEVVVYNADTGATLGPPITLTR